MRIRLALSITVVAMLAACTEPKIPMGGAVDNDQDVLTGGPITGTTIQDLPQTVKETLRQTVPEAEIARMNKITKDGTVIYEISFTEPGKTPKMYINEDGTIVQKPLTRQK